MSVREQSKCSYFAWNVLKLRLIFRPMENMLSRKGLIFSLSN